MSRSMKFAGPPPLAPAIPGSRPWPQDSSVTPVTEDCFNSALTQEAVGKPWPSIYALWIPVTRLVNNARSFAQVNRDIAIGVTLHGLCRLLLANFYRRKGILGTSDSRPTSALVFRHMLANDGKTTLGYFMVNYEADPPGRGDRAEMDPDDPRKEQSTGTRRTCGFGVWLNKFMSPALSHKQFVELSDEGMSNGPDMKLSIDDYNAWGKQLWDMRKKSEYIRCAAEYLDIRVRPNAIGADLNDETNPICPTNVFKIENAVRAYMADVRADRTATSAQGDADEKVALVLPNPADIEAELSFMDNIRYKGIEPTRHAWLLLHDFAFPRIFDTLQMPHFVPIIDDNSASVISYLATRDPRTSREDALRDFRNHHAVTTGATVDLEQFRLEMVARSTRMAADRKALTQLRMNGLHLFRTVWSPDRNYAGGALGAVIKFGIDKEDKKQSMCTLMTLTSPNVDPLGQLHQLYLDAYEILYKTASMHVGMLLANIAILASSIDDHSTDEQMTLYLFGPTGASKSHVTKRVSGDCITGSVEHVAHATDKSDTGDQNAQAHIRIYDDMPPAKLGVDKANESMSDLVRRVGEGGTSSGAGGDSSQLFKHTSTNRSVGVRSIDTTVGRMTYAKTTIIFGARLIASNVESAEMPPPIADRGIILDCTDAKRADGTDIYNARVASGNERQRAAAREKIGERYRNEQFLTTRQNQLEACCISPSGHWTIAGRLLDVLTRNLEDGHYTGLRTARGVGKTMKVIRVVTQRRANTLTYGLGIGGPDPSRTFRDTDTFMAIPFYVSTLSVVTHSIELMRLFLSDNETDLTICIRNHYFREYFEAEAAYEKENPNEVINPHKKHPIEFLKTPPKYHGQPIVKRGDYLVIEHMFANRIGFESDEAKEALKKGSDSEKEHVEAMGIAKCLVRILDAFLTSMTSRPTMKSAVACLAGLMRPRVKGVNEDQPIAPIMVVDVKSNALWFNKCVLETASRDIVWNTMKGILSKTDTGTEVFVRGRTEGDYFTLLKDKIGRNADSEEALEAFEQEEDSVQANPFSEHERLVSKSAYAASSFSAAAAAVSATTLKKKKAAARASGLVPGSRSGALITQINNPDFCSETQIQKTIRSNLLTMGESESFSGESKINTDLISDETALREHVARLRAIDDGDSTFHLPADITHHYLNPKNTRAIIAVIYYWHEECNRFKLAVHKLKRAGSKCTPADVEAYKKSGAKLIEKFGEYFITLDKYSALRENVSPGWIEVWLVQFEIRLTYKRKRVHQFRQGGGDYEESIDLIRDVLYRYCECRVSKFRLEKSLAAQELAVKRQEDLPAAKFDKTAYELDCKRREEIVEQMGQLNDALSRHISEYKQGLDTFMRLQRGMSLDAALLSSLALADSKSESAASSASAAASSAGSGLRDLIRAESRVIMDESSRDSKDESMGVPQQQNAIAVGTQVRAPLPMQDAEVLKPPQSFEPPLKPPPEPSPNTDQKHAVNMSDSPTPQLSSQPEDQSESAPMSDSLPSQLAAVSLEPPLAAPPAEVPAPSPDASSAPAVDDDDAKWERALARDPSPPPQPIVRTHSEVARRMQQNALLREAQVAADKAKRLQAAEQKRKEKASKATPLAFGGEELKGSKSASNKPAAAAAAASEKDESPQSDSKKKRKRKSKKKKKSEFVETEASGSDDSDGGGSSGSENEEDTKFRDDDTRISKKNKRRLQDKAAAHRKETEDREDQQIKALEQRYKAIQRSGVLDEGDGGSAESTVKHNRRRLITLDAEEEMKREEEVRRLKEIVEQAHSRNNSIAATAAVRGVHATEKQLGYSAGAQTFDEESVDPGALADAYNDLDAEEGAKK